MTTILLPTDYSENAWNAITYALHLFKNEECTFYLLNTYTPVIYHVEYVLVSPAQFGLGDAIRDVSMKNMNETVEKIEKEFNNPKHHFETICVFNTLISEIKEVVKEKDIDFVVMGTKGATGAKEVLFGSNTVQAFQNVKCPVIAIPENYEFETPHEILFPSDYDVTFQDQHVKPIIDIAKSYTARVNIMHVSFGYELSDIQEENKRRLAAYFKEVSHLFHDVRNESVADAINQFQVKSKINLLAMLNNKHSFFENLFFQSTLNQIGFHLNVPFLVIPSKT